MTTRPSCIDFDRTLIPGLIAVGLFGLLSLAFLTEGFSEAAGFPDVSIVGGIGYAIIGAPAEAGVAGTASFFVALILLAIVLDAALDGALMLAKRDEGGEQ